MKALKEVYFDRVVKDKLKVGIIAAEHSGDRLGAKIIKSLQDLFEIDLYGLGGPEVNAHPIITPLGIDYHDLHVMGLIDPLINFPKILLNRRKLLKLFISKINCFKYLSINFIFDFKKVFKCIFITV